MPENKPVTGTSEGLPSQRLIGVDLLRGLAIFLVVSGHGRTGLPFPEAAWIQAAWNRAAGQAGLGVFIFFVLSGFLITHMLDRSPSGLLRPDLRSFYVRRAGRILPLFFLTLGFGLWVYSSISIPSNRAAYCFRGPGAPYGPWFWACLPTFSFNWFLAFHPLQDYPRHWTMIWSLAVEEQFYLLYPLLLRRIGSVRHLKVFLGGIILLGFLSHGIFLALWPSNIPLLGFSSLSGFELIAMGAWLYLFLKEHPQLFRSPGAASGAAFVGLTVLTTLLMGWITLPEILFQTVWGSATTLVLAGALRINWEGRSLARLAAKPGEMSYGLYLWHISVLYFIAPFFQDHPWSLIYPAYLAATLGWAALSYRFFEKPVNRAIRAGFMA